MQALEACATQSVHDACRFRPAFADLELVDQLAMIRNCLEISGPALWSCAAKHDRLVDWILAGDEAAQ